MKTDTERRQKHYYAMQEATQQRRARDARLGIPTTSDTRLSAEEKKLVRKMITDSGLPPLWEASAEEYSEDEMEKIKKVQKKQRTKLSALKEAQRKMELKEEEGKTEEEVAQLRKDREAARRKKQDEEEEDVD
ncbi:MAG: hypothetical protein GY820_18235 [Gammaproteobacteria bacterium]|nr:hypothetical protein [Gammaproteobacteria bacterium]